MISADMREYSYYLYGGRDSYGQQQQSSEVQGTIKLAISTTSQNTVNNIMYSEATYLGLTLSNEITDKFVIQYGEKRLKVLYVNQKGRYKQAFLKEI